MKLLRLMGILITYLSEDFIYQMLEQNHYVNPYPAKF